MRFFVTGGSGFVGGAVTRALDAENEVHAMARSAEAAEVVTELGATAVRCSLEDVAASDLEGAHVVVHAAALTAEWAPAQDYQRVNHEGTLRLLDAAREAGVPRFVYVGSDSAHFHGQSLRNMDEGTPLATDSPFPYASSKARAEAAVIAASEDGGGFETVVVKPVLVWGPGDRAVLPQLVAMADRGAWVWLSGGRVDVSTTHIDNFVHGVSLAIEHGRSGESYFIVDAETHLLRSFLTAYAATAGAEFPDRSIPAPVARAAATVVEPLWQMVRPGKMPPISRFAVATLSRDVTVDSDKAARELGYQPIVDFETGLATCVV